MALDYASPLARALLFYWPLVPSRTVQGSSGGAFNIGAGPDLRQLVPRALTGVASASSRNNYLSYFSGSEFQPLPVRYDPALGATPFVKADGEMLIGESGGDAASANVASPWSLSGWFRPLSITSGDNVPLICKGSSSGDFVNVLFAASIASGHLRMGAFSTVGSFNFKGVDGTTNLAFGNWYHVACSWNSAGSAKIYVNGRLDGSTAISGTLSTPFVEWRFGRWAFGRGTLQAQNIAVWSGRELTGAEVFNLYTRPWQMLRPVKGTVIVP